MRLLLLVPLLAVASSCGGGPAGPTTTPLVTRTAAPADAPSITAVSPDHAVAGSSDIAIRITGTNFKAPDGSSPNGTWALWSVNGDVDLDTRFVSGTELMAIVPARLLHDPTVAKVSVVTGDSMAWSDGYRRYPRSNAVEFTIDTSNGMNVVYSATFTASGSCASELPAAARERTYTATMFADGSIGWDGPTVDPPSEHAAISSGKITGDVFSFFIDVERDPQSDDFHGIWDNMGGGTILNISGKGAGAVHAAEITGTLNGLIAFYEPTGIGFVGRYCQASDHAFRFVRR